MRQTLSKRTPFFFIPLKDVLPNLRHLPLQLLILMSLDVYSKPFLPHALILCEAKIFKKLYNQVKSAPDTLWVIMSPLLVPSLSIFCLWHRNSNSSLTDKKKKKKTQRCQCEGRIHGLHNAAVPAASRISRESWKRQRLQALGICIFFPGAFLERMTHLWGDIYSFDSCLNSAASYATVLWVMNI